MNLKNDYVHSITETDRFRLIHAYCVKEKYLQINLTELLSACVGI
jgi:hypothetical protein